VTSGTVAHVIAPQVFGGAESVVESLAFGIQQTERPVHVVALIQQPLVGHPFVEQLRMRQVPVTILPCRGRRYLRQIRMLSDVFRAIGASVVHTHIYHADFVGYYAARRCGLPVVSTVHGITGMGWRNAAYIRLDFWLLRRFEAVICVSETVRTLLLQARVHKRRLHLVHNGCPSTDYLPRADARRTLGIGLLDKTVGWVGRMSHEKGGDLFIEAVGPLVRGGTRAVLVGDGNERAQIEARVRQLGIEEGVLLAGQRADAPRLLRAFDTIVISSRTEGLPMLLLEAMAAGVPIVSYAVGGIPTVLTEDRGWLVSPGDVTALREAIRQAVNGGEHVRARAEHARRAAEGDLSLASWVNRILAIYDRAAAAHEGTLAGTRQRR